MTDDELDTMLESGQTDVFTQNVSIRAPDEGRGVDCMSETTTRTTTPAVSESAK